MILLESNRMGDKKALVLYGKAHVKPRSYDNDTVQYTVKNGVKGAFQ